MVPNVPQTDILIILFIVSLEYSWSYGRIKDQEFIMTIFHLCSGGGAA